MSTAFFLLMFLGWALPLVAQEGRPPVARAVTTKKASESSAPALTLSMAKADAYGAVIDVLEDRGGGKLSRLNWPLTVVPLWEVNSQGAYEFFWGATIQIPSLNPISSVQAGQSIVGFSRDEATESSRSVSIFVKMTSLRDDITLSFRDGSEKKFILRLRALKNPIVTEGCSDLGLSFRQKVNQAVGAKSPTKGLFPLPYLAYRCDIRATTIQVSVSVPAEVEWITSSLFELKGKGRRWKLFEVNQASIQAQTTVVGDFSFKVREKPVPFELISERVEVKREIGLFRFSLGFFSGQVRTLTKQDSVVKPSAVINLQVRPFERPITLGGQGLSTLPSPGQKSYFTHTESVAYAGYVFKWKDWNLEPRAYGYFADGISQSLQFFYTMTTPALGGEISREVGENMYGSAEALMFPVGEQTILSVRLSYGWKRDTGTGGYGANLIYNALSAKKGTAEEGNSAQTFVGGFFDF